MRNTILVSAFVVLVPPGPCGGSGDDAGPRSVALFAGRRPVPQPFRVPPEAPRRRGNDHWRLGRHAHVDGANIEELIEQYYNRRRLHSALSYRAPEEFEQRGSRNAADFRSASVHFFENDENSENAERGSTKLSGDEDSSAVLFPRPSLMLGWTYSTPARRITTHSAVTGH